MNWNLSSIRRLLVASVVSLSLFGCGGGGSTITPPQQKQMATPAITPTTSNQVACSVSVNVTDATAGATIYYTTDGSTPTAASTVYGGPFTINCPTASNLMTVKAYAPAMNSGYLDSSVASAAYKFQVPMATPAITPATGNVVGSVSVSISDATAGATIYYTTDGSTPTTKSSKYIGPFVLSAPVTGSTITVTTYAPAEDASHVDSTASSATYTFVKNPTINVGTLSGPVLLNSANVVLPVTTTNCLSMTYSITPDFPVPPNNGGVLGSVTFSQSNPCKPIFSPGSTMPNPGAQYAVTFTAVGAQGTTSATGGELTINLTTPAITMDPTTPITPATLPAGSGDATLTFNGTGCPFTSWNGVAYGAADYWSGTLDGPGTPQEAEDGLSAIFTDCNHVYTQVSYNGEIPGPFYEYLFNPTPGGGVSPLVILTFVATSSSSSVVTAGDSVATLQSTAADQQGSAKAMASPSARPAPSARQITFGDNTGNTVAAGDIHQLVACGANAENFCGLGKTSLTTFNANGVATSIANVPEDADFAVANNNGTYVFSKTGNLYSLDAKTGAFTLMNGFTTSGVKTAAISNNTIAALTSDGQLQLYDAANQTTLGSYTVPSDSNNIAFTSDNYVLVGKLGSKTLTVLDRSGNSNSYELPASLLTLTSSDSGEALASLDDGTVVAVDSYGNTALRARTNKAEDLYAGFRVLGRTLVLAPADDTGVRHLTRLTVDVQ